ncbi:MAG TPA: exodeoxyribonuclease III [Gammaproteobacteria bacterium]|nr:exodeoxyribonuclease III [Gammaproteobacteria bacterium]
MRVISFNVNGIRAAARKGFFDWLARQNADVICIQELKAQVDQLNDPVFHPTGYHVYYVAAQRKGYSGVALLSRQQPDSIITAMGCDEFDNEGRYVEARFGNLSIASLYAPSGSSNDLRQASKERFMAYFPDFLKKLRSEGRESLICGDYNIAHRNIDIKNWRSNQKNSGFLPHERAWLDGLFGEWGFRDAFRELLPDAEQYTWWSNRGRARENNVGWRIDYQVATPELAARAYAASVYREHWFSDHAPLVMDYHSDIPAP